MQTIHTVDRMQRWVQTCHEPSLGWAAVHVRGSVHYYRAEDERIRFGLHGTGAPKPPRLRTSASGRSGNMHWRLPCATTVQHCVHAHKTCALSRGTLLRVGTTRTRQIKRPQ